MKPTTERRIVTVLIGAVFLVTTGCRVKTLSSPVSCDTVPAWRYQAWHNVMRDFVRDGRTDYEALNKRPENLDRFIAQLGCYGPTRTPQLFADRQARLAYWINAYNALAMLAAVDAYPAKTVRPAFGRFRTAVAGFVDGRTLTLAQIAESAIAESAGDFRVGLALADPAKGSGRQLGVVYTGDDIDRQLDDQIRQALTDPALVKIDHDNWTLWLGRPVYEHRQSYVVGYRQTVGTDGGTIVNALARYADATTRRRLNAAVGYAVRPLPYDWSLNERTCYKCSLD